MNRKNVSHWWEIKKNKDGDWFARYMAKTPIGNEVVFTQEGHKNKADVEKLLTLGSRRRMLDAPIVVEK